MCGNTDSLPKPVHVMFVAERNGLSAAHTDIGVIGRRIQHRHHPRSSGENEDSAEDTSFGNGVRGGMKDLGHSFNRSDVCDPRGELLSEREKLHKARSPKNFAEGDKKN